MIADDLVLACLTLMVPAWTRDVENTIRDQRRAPVDDTIIGAAFAVRRKNMLKWLRGGNASQRVEVIESVKLDGKRSIKLVRRDNIEHLVLVGGRNDLVIEPNIVRRPAAKPAQRPASETRGLPPPGVPTREPLTGSPPKSRQHDLGELTRRLEAELRGSPPLRRHSPPPRTEAESLTQSDANIQVESDGEDAVPNDGTEKSPARAEVEKDQ